MLPGFLIFIDSHWADCLWTYRCFIGCDCLRDIIELPCFCLLKLGELCRMICSYRSLILNFCLCFRRIWMKRNVHWTSLICSCLDVRYCSQHLFFVGFHHVLNSDLFFLFFCCLVPILDQLCSSEDILPELSENWALLNLSSVGFENIFFRIFFNLSFWILFIPYLSSWGGKCKATVEYISHHYGQHNYYYQNWYQSSFLLIFYFQLTLYRIFLWMLWRLMDCSLLFLHKWWFTVKNS